jgi:hypothetical protein
MTEDAETPYFRRLLNARKRAVEERRVQDKADDEKKWIPLTQAIRDTVQAFYGIYWKRATDQQVADALRWLRSNAIARLVEVRGGHPIVDEALWRKAVAAELGLPAWSPPGEQSAEAPAPAPNASAAVHRRLPDIPHDLIKKFFKAKEKEVKAGAQSRLKRIA